MQPSCITSQRTIRTFDAATWDDYADFIDAISCGNSTNDFEFVNGDGMLLESYP